jgi:hypothetical protein
VVFGAVGRQIHSVGAAPRRRSLRPPPRARAPSGSPRLHARRRPQQLSRATRAASRRRCRWSAASPPRRTRFPPARSNRPSALGARVAVADHPGLLRRPQRRSFGRVGRQQPRRSADRPSRGRTTSGRQLLEPCSPFRTSPLPVPPRVLTHRCSRRAERRAADRCRGLQCLGVLRGGVAGPQLSSTVRPRLDVDPP